MEERKDDLVERLRQHSPLHHLLAEAADEIERLRREVEELRDLLGQRLRFVGR